MKTAARNLLPCILRLAVTATVMAQWSPAHAWMCPTAVEEEVVALINQERQNNGLPALVLDVRLVEAARLHSQDMASNNFFSHTGSDGSDFTTRIDNSGYFWYTAAENIAAGYSTAAAVVNGWMNSPGHRANILNSSMRDIGVGYAYDALSTYGHYWTADFGNSYDSPMNGSCNEPQYTLTVTKQGPGTVTVSTGTLTWNGTTGTATYGANTPVTLTANADAGAFFAGWSEDCVGNASSCDMTMNDTKSVTATFSFTADFTASPISGYAPLLVSLTDASSILPSSWLWDFGDGTTYTAQNPSHLYKNVGSYNVKLTASDENGSVTVTKTNYITVSPCPNAKVHMASSYFASIQTAYDQSFSGDVIEMQAVDFIEALVLGQDKTVTLKGGYNCDCTCIVGYSTLDGSITIEKGTVIIDGVVVG
ncbi:MAG TPA: CAP domain-containing protein [Thermodesulfovibrionales bacterium]|nr:CAP domain-containing protein [Thermodesulfovibrionales bacterium]